MKKYKFEFTSPELLAIQIALAYYEANYNSVRFTGARLIIQSTLFAGEHHLTQREVDQLHHHLATSGDDQDSESPVN